jgi:hypothetical protein
MSGEKSGPRVEKFWWLLTSIAGAVAGSVSTAIFGTFNTLLGIVGIAIPAGLALLAFEWSTGGRRGGGRKARAEVRHSNQAPRRVAGAKTSTPRRGQLHAITGRKSSEPPASGTR